jgi:creatinine deaminase
VTAPLEGQAIGELGELFDEMPARAQGGLATYNAMCDRLRDRVGGMVDESGALATAPRSTGSWRRSASDSYALAAMTDREMLEVALEEARAGLAEGGIPIGAALFTSSGELLGRGHNRRIQEGDPSLHGETDAFRRAGRRRTYRDTVMVTTLAPCWYCSGLVRQFGIPKVVVGESNNFSGGIDWLRESGVEVVDLDSDQCTQLLRWFISAHPDVWNEDIGED